MEEGEKADFSYLRQLYKFLMASKELTIAKVALKVSKQRHAELLIKAQDGFRGDVWRRCKRDISAVKFMSSTLVNDSWT